MNDPHRELVEKGYDRVAKQYLATKDPQDPLALSALEEMARDLPPGAAVLDLGCGAGVPATRWLAARGFTVTGVDFSERQLGLARKLVPDATFVKADMTALEFEPGTFGAVVAFHSIIHVPREEHLALLEKIHRWLGPGGLFLATLTLTGFEGEDYDWEGWGAPMRWSHYDAETNVTMLRRSGFDILHAEPRTGDDEETWLWTLARKDLPR
ncbi:MAG: class I SAM-dependent methyltransferase [Rubrobacter sp.]|nr:class I SAM-dependent methyltransferase [Rubrobacter sp.]MBA3610634.1 class I SAM-dependent methyltransferase [Rubrobacter sp.]MBA3951972.1 class I SAM-dependent methyltransferase [Rubrobacter sp.]MDQ3363771.1 class I SAM-dependent methyltransferase [Actinomycetota bacterium]